MRRMKTVYLERHRRDSQRSKEESEENFEDHVSTEAGGFSLRKEDRVLTFYTAVEQCSSKRDAWRNLKYPPEIAFGERGNNEVYTQWDESKVLNFRRADSRQRANENCKHWKNKHIPGKIRAVGNQPQCGFMRQIREVSMERRGGYIAIARVCHVVELTKKDMKNSLVQCHGGLNKIPQWDTLICETSPNLSFAERTKTSRWGHGANVAAPGGGGGGSGLKKWTTSWKEFLNDVFCGPVHSRILSTRWR
ncbi:hypothetical protein DFH09DRAFT_1067585 [Mycena vulgaris]|nr:hypothetical protein DFH09DRAFT_1067585 [Mycena vulgaris]